MTELNSRSNMSKRDKRKHQPKCPDSLLASIDPFHSLMSAVLTDLHPGDIVNDPTTNQVIYYDSLRRTYTIPATPLTKTQFSNIFGSAQNRPTSLQLSIQNSAKCRLKGDFRVRTIELTAESADSAIAGWNQVLDELCKLPSLRPQKYLVIDRKTHKEVTEVVGKKRIEDVVREVQVIGNLKDVVVMHLLKAGVMGSIRSAADGNAEVVLDAKERSLMITSETSEGLSKAVTAALSTVAQASESIQTLYWSVSLPTEFAEAMTAVMQVDGSPESVYGFIPVTEVIFTANVTNILLDLQPKLMETANGVPINVDLISEEINEKGTVELANTASFGQLQRIHSQLAKTLSDHQVTFAPISDTHLHLHIGVRGLEKQEMVPLMLPGGLETRSLCLGRPDEFPSIELSLV